MKQPIDNIKWVSPSELKSNDYNPNVVLNQELALLKFSLLKQGWIQPILSDLEGEIIDGYHRWWLASNDKEVLAMSDGKIPVVYMDLTEAQRMTLTIRINRAKGNHVAYKMAEIVHKLYKDFEMTTDEISQEIGANKQEVELLLEDGIFSSKNTKDYEYSKAWKPVRAKK